MAAHAPLSDGLAIRLSQPPRAYDLSMCPPPDQSARENASDPEQSRPPRPSESVPQDQGESDRPQAGESHLPISDAVPTPGRLKQRAAPVAQAMRRTDASPAVLRAGRATRQMLPGDAQFGDELSTAGDRPAEILPRYLTQAGI